MRLSSTGRPRPGSGTQKSCTASGSAPIAAAGSSAASRRRARWCVAIHCSARQLHFTC
uniref:Uncharacterized protein n=1 Tax=Triticum urartu TaxID=4572 RepID=A0A8R7QJI1_TRIUA